MKKLLFISAIFLTAFTYKADAQIHLSVNIGNQPVWGPVGYDYAEYYYLPDMDVYYDVSRQQFVYYDLGRWIFAPSLPSRYGRYDLYNSYKVVINNRDPWLRNTYYRGHYASYRGRHQSVIRDSRDQRYFVIKDHPQHNSYQNHGNDNHDRNDHHDNGNHGNNNHNNDHHDNGHGNNNHGRHH